MPSSRLIYAIFEGGGAKGIAHLGAVAAIEQLNLTLAGVAGASAGAFVASLLAAGYRSNELLDPGTPTSNLLAAQNLGPLDLLDVRKWRRFNGMLRSTGWLAGAAMLAGAPGAFCVRPRAMLTLAFLGHGLGHFSTDAVRNFVNDRVRERLGDLWAAAGRGGEVPNPVCFEDLDYVTYPQLRPLKIIATDVLHMRPVLFDRVRTPKVPIGDAVAASIAIPVVFQPVTVRGLPDDLGPALFVDGGLVSNLPFWVFGEEKMAVERANPGDPAVPIIAFTLKDEAPPPPPRGPGKDLPDRVRFYGEASLRGALLGLGLALLGWVARYLATGVTLPVSAWMIAPVVFFALTNMTWGRVRDYGKAAFAGGLLGFVLALVGTIVWSFATGIHSVGTAVETAFSQGGALWIAGTTAFFAGVNLWRARQAHLKAAAGGLPPFVPFLAKTVRTGIFGSQVVAQSLLRDVVQVPLVTRLTVMGFDRPWRDIRADYISGRQCALSKLRMTLQMRTDFFEQKLSEMVDLATQKLSQLRGQPVGPLRASVIEPFGGQSLRVTHSHNMENDADDHLTLDVRGDGAGKAYRNGDAVVIAFPTGFIPPFMTKYERALLRPTLRSAICIPIFDRIDAWERPPAERPKPLGVLSIDSDEDLSVQFANATFIGVMAGPSVLLSPAFKME
jgi:predicted acylesterase/phospholipase RssA